MLRTIGGRSVGLASLRGSAPSRVPRRVTQIRASLNHRSEGIRKRNRFRERVKQITAYMFVIGRRRGGVRDRSCERPCSGRTAVNADVYTNFPVFTYSASPRAHAHTRAHSHLARPQFLLICSHTHTLKRTVVSCLHIDEDRQLSLSCGVAAKPTQPSGSRPSVRRIVVDTALVFQAPLDARRRILRHDLLRAAQQFLHLGIEALLVALHVHVEGRLLLLRR